ncbi:SDR family NAD(P)-dependent oxidoreductase [Mesorhizobium sp. M1334]|uniref:SDR family NAD(P)-dependent oxidoreductase n=1 Tax=Mesorhizobium sp. M1334 TaxID=2957084 RepID=UPI0033396DC6
MSTSHFSLAGKTAIVTGAGRGLGKAIGLGLASCGADVVLASRTLAELAAVVADECRSFGVRAEPLVTDITASDQCDKLVQFLCQPLCRV